MWHIFPLAFISFLSFFIFDVVVEYRLGYQIHSLHLTPSPGADIHPYLTMHPCVHLYVDYLHLQVSTIYWHDGYRMTIQWHDDRNPSDHCQPFIAMQTVPNSPSQNYYIRQHSVCLQTSFTYPEDHHIWWWCSLILAPRFCLRLLSRLPWWRHGRRDALESKGGNLSTEADS